MRLRLLGIVLLAGNLLCAEPLPMTRNAGYYRPIYRPTEPRQLFLTPLLSLVLPGADQYLEGKLVRGATYSLVGLGGIGVYSLGRDNVDHRYRDLGIQMYFLAGGLSLFEAFRTAVYTRRSQGEFANLKVEESPTEIALAPFRIKYMMKMTTLVPLFVGGVFYAYLAPRGGGDGQLTFGDLFYATGNGLMTGVSEECVFRGWMLPMMMHSTGDPTLAHLSTASAYALTHGIRFKHFVTAFLLGLYTGWLAEHNDFAIGEGVFINSWWNVIAFLADYATHEGHATLRLPPLHLRF